MGKFKIGSIKHIENSNIDILNDTEKIKVGAGLLSETSKATVKMEITHIPRNKIKKNPNNKYSIEGIEALSESIRVYGLSDPLDVKKISDDEYMLLGGERRITAIDMLIADPDVEEWNEYSLMPCNIKDINKISLPLSDENKERYAIITTNKEARKYTDGDTLTEIREWKIILEELRENGMESIPGYDEDGNEKEIKIKGNKTRDILAETTGVSRGKINQFEMVENQGTEAIKEALLDNKISVNVAAKAVKELNEEQQDKLAEDSDKKEISVKNISEYKATNAAKNNVTHSSFKRDLKDITTVLRAGEIELDEKDFAQYHFYIKQLKKLFIKGE